MREKVNVTKTEMLLLGLTAVFLCGLLALSHHDRARTPGVTVETAVEVPREELTPDFAPLDLNTAPAEELAKLPGIGEALAERIVSYREEHGPFWVRGGCDERQRHRRKEIGRLAGPRHGDGRRKRK